MTRAGRVAAFKSWCEREDITLTKAQLSAAGGVLQEMTFLGGRATGKTFLLQTIDRFLTEEVPASG